MRFETTRSKFDGSVDEDVNYFLSRTGGLDSKSNETSQKSYINSSKSRALTEVSQLDKLKPISSKDISGNLNRFHDLTSSSPNLNTYSNNLPPPSYSNHKNKKQLTKPQNASETSHLKTSGYTPGRPAKMLNTKRLDITKSQYVTDL